MELLAVVPVAAFVSMAVTLWLRRSDRPQAFWVAAHLTIATPSRPSTSIEHVLAAAPPAASFVASNAGDADAYSVHLEGIDCDPYFLITDDDDPRGGWLTQVRTRVRSGEELNIIVRPLPGRPFRKEKAIVRLIWLRAPVRHMKYEAQEFDAARPEVIAPPQPWKPPFRG